MPVVCPTLFLRTAQNVARYGASTRRLTAAPSWRTIYTKPNVLSGGVKVPHHGEYTTRYTGPVHVAPVSLSDRLAYVLVKALRVPIDLLFVKRYGHRAVVIETIASVPGFVAAMLQHLKCLRRNGDDHGWIVKLLDEAENERMHLMTFMHVAQPNALERAFVLLAQGVFFNAYFLMYLLSPKTAHRFVGYLEEEACVSYSEFLKELEEGGAANPPAPEIARVYWELADDATLKDVVKAVRDDEAEHRDVNHHLSTAIKLCDADAP